MPRIDLSGRHPGTRAVARWFEFDHLPAGLPRDTSEACALVADAMIVRLPDGPDLTDALRSLLAAKDGFVRAAIAAAQDGRDSESGS